MEHENDFLPRSSPKAGVQPVVLISHLMRQSLGMSHIDDVLLWLSRTLTQHLDIAVVQIWAQQQYQGKNTQVEIRSKNVQNPALPLKLHVNNQVAELVGRSLREQREIECVSVTNLFSSVQCAALAQYHLHYWTVYCVYNSLLLPIPKGEAEGRVATPLKIGISLFTRTMPAVETLRSVRFVTEQALRIAASRGFLVPTSQTPSQSLAENAQPVTPPSLPDLIPRRVENPEHLHSLNPFAGAYIITNKVARHLYSTIDGSKTVRELARAAHLQPQEMVETLRYLLQQELIQLHEAGGKVVRPETVFPPRPTDR